MKSVAGVVNMGNYGYYSHIKYIYITHVRKNQERTKYN